MARGWIEPPTDMSNTLSTFLRSLEPLNLVIHNLGILLKFKQTNDPLHHRGIARNDAQPLSSSRLISTCQADITLGGLWSYRLRLFGLQWRGRDICFDSYILQELTGTGPLFKNRDEQPR